MTEAEQRPVGFADKPNEGAERAAVVREAHGWLRTPYHPCAKVRGVGVDCAQLPAAVYADAGVIAGITHGAYSPQWHMHHDDELYLAEVTSHAREIAGPPLPGDFVLYQVGRCWAHGAIVVAWPTIIHALSGVGVVLGNGLLDPLAKKRLGERRPRFFTLWPAAEGLQSTGEVP